MKKAIVITAVFLILAVFSIATVRSVEYLGTREKTMNEGGSGGMMAGAREKMMIENESDRPLKPMIYKMHFMGKGLAVNPIDLNDFSQIAIVAGRVAIPNGSILGKGIMKMGETKYILSNLNVVDEKATADILNEEKAKVGQLSLEKKVNTEIWHGTASTGEKSWHIYMLGMSRNFNNEELAEKAKTYCKENPSDANCNSVSRYVCKDDTEDCKEKVMSFCKDHTDDARCKDILIKYCKLNPDEDRCNVATEPTP